MDTTVSKKPFPGGKAHPAKNRAMPNSRKARFVFSGMCQTWAADPPIRPRISATRRGPPARPSRTGCGKPGNAIGMVPIATAEEDADEDGDEMASRSARASSFQSTSAASSRSSERPTICSLSPNCNLSPGNGGHLEVGPCHPGHRDVMPLVEPEFPIVFRGRGDP